LWVERDLVYLALVHAPIPTSTIDRADERGQKVQQVLLNGVIEHTLVKLRLGKASYE
jgi:hypothetical protein